MMKSILLISFTRTLRSAGINNILHCQDARQVQPILAQNDVYLVLLDLGLPYINGIEILRILVEDHPEIPTIIVTGNNEVDTAVSCMKQGAFDYLTKPVAASRLISVVRRAIDIRDLKHENQLLKERMLDDCPARPEAFTGFISNNRSILSLFQYAKSVAISPQPILVTGESGVGKELMAKAVHSISGRRGELVSVNAAGIDDTVFADTLFGHTPGAFTGADRVRNGLVERAAGGTLVLDEIGDLNMESQVKLLRLIQEGEYFPLGSDTPRTTDARIIVSTNRNLKALQLSGAFRKDLYFRLRAHQIHIPPLRDRLDDLPLLLNHFLEEAALSLGKRIPAYPDQLLQLLSNYHFPGNVRELRAMVYDALSTHQSKILSMQRFQAHMRQERGPDVIDATSSGPDRNPPHQIAGTLPTLKEATVNLIQEAMQRTANNQSMAARLLGVSRQTLARHLKSVDR